MVLVRQMNCSERTIGPHVGSCKSLVWLARLVLACLVWVAGLCPEAGADELGVATRDGARTAIVYPQPRGPAPTVIVLHGALITAGAIAGWSGFAEAAAAKGFASVFPRGINLLWNDGRRDGLANSDDVGFLGKLVHELVGRGVADPRRVYLAGISNGGMMTLRMLCEEPQLFAGAATVVASMPSLVGATCRLRKPMPIVMLNGTADPVVPYNGGKVGLTKLYGEVWSVERTAALLARGNGCRSPAEHVLAPVGLVQLTKVMQLDWSACSSGQPVTLYRVEGGGHQVFGSTNFFSLVLGVGTNQVSAPDAIMATFAKTRP
jgi:polyhydroxybutyrate depolymerase